MTRLTLLGAAALLSFALAACGDDHHDHGCGLEANCDSTQLDYSDGLTVMGGDGRLGLRVISATPNPPDPTMENTWTVEILDANGDPISSGTSITKINTWSVDCGHFGIEGEQGLDLTGIDNGDGTFTFSFLYAHGGPWNVELDVTDGGATDHVTVGLCLPETGPHMH